MLRKVTLEVQAFLFMLLFFYTAISKLVGYSKFKVQIGQSPLLTGFGEWLPGVVIAVELGVGFLLMFSRYRLIGFFGAYCLMVMFTVYVIAILHFSPFVPCSCGGVLEVLGWREHLVFNGTFAGIALWGIVWERQAHANRSMGSLY
jgi:hypothetical protein